ncbi:MAG: HNH endonuclease [Gammaproteobacteria bacterium]
MKSLSDDELLRRTFDRVAQSRTLEWDLVAHINEIDERRLYRREGSPSMIQYCMDFLHLSEGQAFRRITAARTSREFPVIIDMLKDGRIHLCGVSALSKHLTRDNHENVLARATHKSKRDIEKLARELDPKPDVQPSIRKRPQRKTKPTPSSASASGLFPGRVDQAPEVSTPPPPDKPPKVEPLAPARYKVEFTASEELRNKLTRLEAHMWGCDLAAVIDQAVSEKLERLDAKRFGKTNNPRKNVEDADTSPGKRYIAAPVRRAVWERDGGQCTFVSEDGRRCPEVHQLEFHHDDPYAEGGGNGTGNIRLLCQAHNAYMAELDFGKEKMDQYRRSRP